MGSQPATGGSPTLREAHYKDLHIHGSRSAPEASLCVQGKPEKGRHGDKYTVMYMETGLCRRPYCRHLGSPTAREAYRMSMPEASLCVQGKIDKAGGPVMNTL